jgi:hypothetical protein
MLEQVGKVEKPSTYKSRGSILVRTKLCIFNSNKRPRAKLPSGLYPNLRSICVYMANKWSLISISHNSKTILAYFFSHNIL